jgi:hypothetical protein
MGLRRVELSLLRLGHLRATAVSAAAGRLAHAVDDIPMRGVSTCASGRAALSLYPCTPASEGRIQKNVEGMSTHPQAGGGAVMGKAVDRPVTSAPFRPGRARPSFSPLCPRKLRPDTVFSRGKGVGFLLKHFS